MSLFVALFGPASPRENKSVLRGKADFLVKRADFAF
jgi:hypothetical protein